MTAKNVSEIRIEFNMEQEEYYEWNIENASRTLVRKPGEREITLAAYECHKNMLKNKGMSKEKLARGDDELITRVRRYAQARHNN